MSDKPVAMLVTFLAVAPICFLCIFAPVAIGGFFVWLAGFFSGLSPVISTGLAIVISIPILGYIKKRKNKHD